MSDKVVHIVCCYCIVLTLSLCGMPVVSAGLVSALVGLLKELIDERSGNGTPDRYDLLANLIGCVLGIAVVEVVTLCKIYLS